MLANDEMLISLRDQAREELARRHLVDFAERTVSGFQCPTHILYVAGFLERVARGEIKRLCISFAPGHGKSTILQCFVAWVLGCDPSRRVLALSASEDLARRNSRAIRSLVQSDAWPFVGVRLSADSTSSLEWRTEQNGGVKALGTGGTVTGYRAEGVLCDDVQADAGSETTNASLEEWFRGVLSTRLEPDGWVVMIATRWGDADLVGRITEGESAEQWTVINIPAIANEDDVLGRGVGEALWPERWSVAALEQKRQEVGSLAFACQYQGDPAPRGGTLFKPEWFEHRFDALPSQRVAPPLPVSTHSEFERMMYGTMMKDRYRELRPIIIQCIDSAWRDGPANDRSCIATLVSDGVDIYVSDVFFDRLKYPDLRRAVLQQYDKHRPSRVYVEEAASGFAIVAELKSSTPVPIVGINPGRDSKEARAESVTGLFESGRVKFPAGAPWIGELLNEFLRFPHGRHDDIVDAVTRGVGLMWDHILDERERQRRGTREFNIGR